MNNLNGKNILNSYVKYLNQQGLSPLSIKNYKSDINLFLNSTQINDQSMISREIIDQYMKFLEKTVSVNIFKRKKTAFVHLKNYLGLNQEIFYDFRQMFQLKAPYIVLFAILSFYVLFQTSRDANSTKIANSDIKISSVPITQLTGEVILAGTKDRKIVLLNDEESPTFTQALSGEILKNYQYNTQNINSPIHGTAVMNQNQKNTKIYDSNINQQSNIFLTLNSKSEANIYISQVFEGGFEVSRERALDNISFGWLSIN